jgi:hypothetical protein
MFAGNLPLSFWIEMLWFAPKLVLIFLPLLCSFPAIDVLSPFSKGIRHSSMLIAPVPYFKTFLAIVNFFSKGFLAKTTGS